jgi:FixJ family two-component response regulator
VQDANVIQKPVKEEELAAAVQRVLGRTGSARNDMWATPAP